MALTIFPRHRRHPDMGRCTRVPCVSVAVPSPCSNPRYHPTWFSVWADVTGAAPKRRGMGPKRLRAPCRQVRVRGQPAARRQGMRSAFRPRMATVILVYSRLGLRPQNIVWLSSSASRKSPTKLYPSSAVRGNDAKREWR